MSKIISFNYQGIDNRFIDDGWFNATEAVGKFRKRPVDWLKQEGVINYALTGEFRGIDRDCLPEQELSFLVKLEEKNTVWIGRGITYEERKKILEQQCLCLRRSQQHQITS